MIVRLVITIPTIASAIFNDELGESVVELVVDVDVSVVDSMGPHNWG